jgi:hypothetical protein
VLKSIHLLLLALIVTVWANTSFAHQQKSAETTMLITKDGKRLEVSHRFYLHDTEHAVQALLDKDADILSSTKTQQQFAGYVEKQFTAHTLNYNPLLLKSVGYEVEGKFFWVYQEVELSGKLEGLKVRNGSLRDLWPTQVNMVNIEGQGNVRTLYFDDQEDWLTVKF